MTSSDQIQRIGAGSIGGKGRAIGYLGLLVERLDLSPFKDVMVRVPKAAALTTPMFEEFVEINELSHCITAHDDELTLHAFERGRFPSIVFGQLRRFLEENHTPLAVRSSSLNEDAYDHPFAGLYKTVLLPNNAPDIDSRLQQLCQAIKLVYASTYLTAPKSYMRRYGLPIEDEAMAVVIQELAGRQYRTRFYPRVAGSAQSINYFPVGRLTQEDGVCRLVVGLGSKALAGEEAAWFAPRRPDVRPDYWSPRRILDTTQRTVDVLDLSRGEVDLALDERTTLKEVPLDRIRGDGSLEGLDSWWNPEDDTVTEGGLPKGRPLLTFNQLLRGDLFPFTELLCHVLDAAEAGIRGPVELEFAADYDVTGKTQTELCLLQVRRIGRPRSGDTVELEAVGSTRLLLSSHTALGNGRSSGISHIVYVSPTRVPSDRFPQLAAEVGRINHRLEQEGASYLLIGPGRWGTKNSRLGIPVTYYQVSRAAAIAEVSTPGFRVAPSQGTHFFHNITAGEVFYLSVDLASDDTLDIDWLEAQPDARGELESEVKLIALAEEALILEVDGRTQRGQVFRA